MTKWNALQRKTTEASLLVIPGSGYYCGCVSVLGCRQQMDLPVAVDSRGLFLILSRGINFRYVTGESVSFFQVGKSIGRFKVVLSRSTTWINLWDNHMLS